MLTPRTLLVVLVLTSCANIHCNSKQPQLGVVGEAAKRWQGGFAGQIPLDGRWWTPRLLLANKVEAKKSLDNALKKFLPIFYFCFLISRLRQN